MPTVLLVDGYAIVIYTQDHLPPHVHVTARGCEAIVNLRCPSGPPELRENYRFKARDLRQIMRIVAENLKLLCAEWERIHADL